MGTIKLHLKPTKKQLLLAAVVLFCLIPLIAQLNQEKSIVIEQAKSDEEISAGQTYLTANTLAALTNQDLVIDEPETSLSTLQENILLSQANPITFISQEPRTGPTTYIVQEGDSASSIAASFGITTYTLLWANNLKETSIIRPGDELIILPVSGILHRVKDGDTVDSIATKYQAESKKIIGFNDLPADGAIQIGQKLVVPDGQMPIVKPKIVQQNYYVGPGTGKSRSFPYGQCTWYVAQKRYVPWSGHAKYWLANAQANGYKTGTTPQAGAIMVLSEGGWLGYLYGHVAYVEAVQGSWVTISEMNYTCYACKSVRTLKINDRRIRGYIY